MKQLIYNVALYMRLSRDDDNYGDSVSIETQRTILRQFAKENQFHVVDEYVDAAVIIGLKTLRLKKCCKFGIF